MSLKYQKRIGEILIITAISGLIFIYYPYVKELFFPPVYSVEEKNSVGFSIEIPSINVFSRVIENVDAFDKNEYLEELKKGVAHAQNSKLPGEGGTVYLFAHSSDVPWRITRYNTAFFKLENVKLGETVIVRRNGEEYSYQVFDKKTVWPSEVEYLKEDQGDILILQTCTPVGTDLQRLLVFAKPM